MLELAGTIFNPFDSLMCRLGVSPSAAVDLARDLHVHAVASALCVLALRRRLDHPKASTPDIGQALPPQTPVDLLGFRALSGRFARCLSHALVRVALSFVFS